MPRREQIAERMADAVLKRLTTRKIIDVKDEGAARAAIRHVVIDNLVAEEKLDADARQLLGKVREKLARDRGFIL